MTELREFDAAPGCAAAGGFSPASDSIAEGGQMTARGGLPKRQARKIS
jgi:hypothetical protein